MADGLHTVDQKVPHRSCVKILTSPATELVSTTTGPLISLDTSHHAYQL